MAETKRICFIIAGLSGGGMERSLTSLANYYAENGHKICILTLFRTEQFFELHNQITVLRPPIKRVNFNRLIYSLKIIHYIRKNIRDFSPDVLVSFGVWINSYIILSTRFLNIPLFISDRMGPKLYLGLLLETARKLTYKYATGIIAQTKIAAEIIRRQTKAENIEVIPNAINVIDTDVSIKKNQIVTTGRLSVEKGHTILLNAFSRINHKDWTLHIVGDGPERGNLLDEAKSLGIQDKIVFYGQLKDFSTILGVSKIFVLSSYYEGFPNALVEAMSVPLACISTDCIAGPADIIQNGMNGLLVPTGDCDALRDALERLIENIELQNYLSKNAFKIRVTLNFELIAQRYLNFFTQSLNQA